MFEIYRPLENAERLERVEHMQCHTLALLQEILRLVVSLPTEPMGTGTAQKIAAVTERLKQSAEALQVATQAVSSSPSQKEA